MLCSESKNEARMKPQTKFQRLLQNRQNKRLLIYGYRFPHSTVSMWANGNRVPSWETAKKLSKIFKIPIRDIPYYRIERNI